MKVILLKDVKGKGKKDDIIEVSDGYGNNYLIKNKLGVLYTKGSKTILDKELNLRQEKEAALVSELNEIKKKLENTNIKFKVNTGKDGRVFGNVSTKQICDELKKKGYNIDKKCIKTNSNIDSLGVHKVLIELHKKVSFFINVVVDK
ncbi:MAG: 50S ribosomal protein L9 [Firmicutes bacterium]|nr:50S ribosomal protein L9 [Bacillota bacterium]